MEELLKVKTLFKSYQISGLNTFEAAEEAVKMVLGWNGPYIYRDGNNEPLYVFYNSHVLFFDGSIYEEKK